MTVIFAIFLACFLDPVIWVGMLMFAWPRVPAWQTILPGALVVTLVVSSLLAAMSVLPIDGFTMLGAGIRYVASVAVGYVLFCIIQGVRSAAEKRMGRHPEG